MTIDRYTACAALLLAAGCALRAVGFTRGASDFVLPEDRQRGWDSAFYTFHPDEADIVAAALEPIDLLDPPFTVYGTLPVYALRGALLAVSGLADWDLSLATPASKMRVYLTARAMALLASVGVLGLVWVMGRRLAGPGGGLAALFATAFSPGAIQQAHFYIVDGPFALASLAALWAILRALERGRRADFLAAGLLIGATASVRYNGCLLGLVLAAGLIGRGSGGPARRLAQAVGGPRLWLAAAAALLVATTLHAYALVRPQLLVRAEGLGDFHLALKFTRGTYLQPWTLVDAEVTPYLDHWFATWPLISGWPLALVFPAALGWAAWRGGRAERLLALWAVLYFLPVGALSARAVRYMVPLLGPLALLAAARGKALASRLTPGWPRRGAAGAAALAAGHLLFFGTAFGSVYTEEDSRIQAGRFLADRVAPGATVGVEGGAFTVAHQVSDRRHRRRWVDVTRLMYAGPYMLCADRVDYLRSQVEDLDVLAYVDVNHAAHYAAVPHLFPVAAAFYRELEAGRLGFDRLVRLKTYPGVGPLSFRDDGVDPTYLGYDHPAVVLLRRRDGAHLEAAFARWREVVASDPWCPDRDLQAAVGKLREGGPLAAVDGLERLTARNPTALLAYRVLAEARRRAGDEAGAERAMARFRPETAGGRMAYLSSPEAALLATAASAASLVRLGLVEVAMGDLEAGLDPRYAATPQEARARALSYLTAAEALSAAGHPEAREEVARLSLRIHPTPEANNLLAHLTARRGQLEAARRLLEASLGLDADQPLVHLALGELYLETPAGGELAILHLARAAELEPRLAARAQRLRDRAAASRPGPP